MYSQCDLVKDEMRRQFFGYRTGPNTVYAIMARNLATTHILTVLACKQNLIKNQNL